VTDEQRIRDLVRRVVYRTVGRVEPPAVAAAPDARLVTERDVQEVPCGGSLQMAAGALVTPLARQAALERRVRLDVAAASPALATAGCDDGPTPAAIERTIAVGADHAGVTLKAELAGLLGSLGYRVVDCGTGSSDPVDYPDIALAVAQLVAGGHAGRGILIDGAGVGSCMAANKVPGVRAAACHDEATAVNSREHNHANVLTLGAGMISGEQARRIVTTWLETPAAGGRHQRRVDKITDIERRYAKPLRGVR
jgi:ribose 5-phosphate isomerase B